MRAFLSCPGHELPVSEALLPTVPREGTILALHGDELVVYRIAGVRSCSTDVVFVDLEPAPEQQEGSDLTLNLSSEQAAR